LVWALWGACPDAADYGVMERFSNKIAIAPTASISIICGGASPGIEPSTANSYLHKTLSGSFAVRNDYLGKVLEKYGHNDEDTWSSITQHEGSVQHLDFLGEHEKMVFKTAFELDQRWLIELAADRAPFVCQAQSLNIFLPANVHKKDLHMIHFLAWKKGVKSLYYCRSKSMQRAESAAHVAAQPSQSMPANDDMAQKVQVTPGEEEANKYDECLSCQ
jgi:ribonucleoside-diphosphate reductase alpha chain